MFDFTVVATYFLAPFNAFSYFSGRPETSRNAKIFRDRVSGIKEYTWCEKIGGLVLLRERS